MSISLNIKRYADTEANLQSLVGPKEFAIGSDTNKCYFGGPSNSNIYAVSPNRYYDGSWHDSDFVTAGLTASGDVSISGDLRPTEYIEKYGATTNYIRLESDKITIDANGGKLYVEDDRAYVSVSMACGGSDISTAALNVNDGLSLDNRVFIITDSVTIASGADQYHTFSLGSNSKCGGVLELSVGGYFSDDTPHAAKISNSFLLSSNSLVDGTQDVIYETVAGAVSLSLYANGANNAINIYTHNNDAHSLSCTLQYQFILHNTTGVSKLT